jgi:hypothetical protein
VADDDEEARKLRAQRLRGEIDALREGKSPEQPPRSPYEFIEREMREHDEDEEEGEKEARKEGERGEGDSPSE